MSDEFFADETFEALQARKTVRGRGTGMLAKSRFERVEVAYEPHEEAQVSTEIYKDSSRSIITYNDSPDVGFSATINPYRGCEHGCIYCYARPNHEYLGLSAGLDFETRIFAKMQAPELLKKELAKPSWKPQVIGLSGVTDCYQPIERKLQLTRQCLEVLAEARNPVMIITKNKLVTRDMDYLAALAEYSAIRVIFSMTTLDKQLARKMEPRTSSPKQRLEAIETLAKAGIPVSVNLAPIIPGLTDSEIPALLKASASAGAQTAGYVLLRLPHGVKDLFENWLAEHYPLRKGKVLNHIRNTRGGQLYNPEFGERMRGSGVFAEQIAQLFGHYTRQYGLTSPLKPLSTAHFRPPSTDGQLPLF